MSDIQAEGGQQQEPERPEWLLEKFKTPEDQARSYAELEKEVGRIRASSDQQQQQFTQALAALEAERAEAPQQQQFAPDQHPLMLAAQRAWDEGDVATFVAINGQVSQMAMKQEIDGLRSHLDTQIGGVSAQDKEIAFRLAEQQVAPMFGDRWSEVVPQIQAALAANPGILPPTASVEGYAQALTNVAKQVDYDRVVKEQEAAAADRQAKLNANTLAGGQARVTYQANPNEEVWSGIKNADAGGWNKVVGG